MLTISIFISIFLIFYMKNIVYVWISIISLVIIILIYRTKLYNINLPTSCILEEHTISEMICCIQKIITTKRRKIQLNMSSVKELSNGAFMVIMAQAEKAYNKGKTIFIKLPDNTPKRIKEVIYGTNQKIYHDYVKLTKNNDKLNDLYKSHKLVDIAQILPNIDKHLNKLGIKNYYELNTLITELLGNAVEHGIKGLNINWWMLHLFEKKSIRFVFVDMGIGIIKSYKTSEALYSSAIFESGKDLSDIELLIYSLKGLLGSSTGKPNRGRGMPQILYMVEKKLISNFVLTTNTVTLRYIDNHFKIQTHPNFVGTYYSWTVDKDNYNKWKELQ